MRCNMCNKEIDRTTVRQGAEFGVLSVEEQYYPAVYMLCGPCTEEISSHVCYPGGWQKVPRKQVSPFAKNLGD